MNCQSFQLPNTEKSRNVFESRKRSFMYYEERKEISRKSNIYTSTGYEDRQMSRGDVKFMRLIKAKSGLDSGLYIMFHCILHELYMKNKITVQSEPEKKKK